MIKYRVSNYEIIPTRIKSIDGSCVKYFNEFNRVVTAYNLFLFDTWESAKESIMEDLCGEINLYSRKLAYLEDRKREVIEMQKPEE